MHQYNSGLLVCALFRLFSQNCLNDLPRKSAVQNHRIFRELPGQVYDAFDQCQLLLKDKDASVFSTEDLYVSLPARSAVRQADLGLLAALFCSLETDYRGDGKPPCSLGNIALYSWMHL